MPAPGFQLSRLAFASYAQHLQQLFNGSEFVSVIIDKAYSSKVSLTVTDSGTLRALPPSKSDDGSCLTAILAYTADYVPL
jgi:hypothetical protein